MSVDYSCSCGAPRVVLSTSKGTYLSCREHCDAIDWTGGRPNHCGGSSTCQRCRKYAVNLATRTTK